MEGGGEWRSGGWRGGGGGVEEVEGGEGGWVEGGGRGGWGICGRRTEPNRTGPHDTEINRGKPKPDRTELTVPFRRVFFRLAKDS